MPRIMSTAGPRVFDSASLVLDNLPVLETCDGPASALRWQTAPIDAAAAAERKRITERAKRAMILRGAGRKKQTKALVTQLTEQLDRLRDPMARAHAARVIAHFQPDRKKAEALFRRAIRDAIIVRDEVTVVNAYADLVANLKDQQRFGDALKEANIAEAHAERMGQFVKTWPSAAIWYPLLSGRIANMRGLIADERGKAEAAIPHYRKTVKLWGRTQKQRPIRLAMALNNLAEVQRKTGRYQEAIANLDKAVAITQKQSSLNTFYYLTMVNNRGMAKLTAGWATRAIADFNLALKLAGKRARAGNIAYNLSLVHTLAEDYAKAETMLARAKTVWLPTIPPEHFVFDLLDVRRCAIARLRLQFAGAIGRCDDAVSRLSKKLGANHPYVAEAMVERALTLLAQGKPAKARHDITAALEVYRKSIGLTTVEAAKARAALGRTLLAMGKPHYDAAETDLRKAMATFSAIKLPRHPASLPALVDLATLMNKRGKTKDALRLVDKAFAVINAPEALVPSREVARIKALKTRLTPGH